MKAQKRILVVVTSHSKMGNTGKLTGYYLPEVSHPVAAFKKAGLSVDFASPQGGKAPMDPSYDAQDPENAALLADSELMKKLSRTLAPSEVQAERYDAVFFAGGHGTMWDFRENRGLQDITRKIFERGSVVAAVCHGPAALVDVRLSDGRYLVAGKKVAGFTDAEEVAHETADVVPFLLETALKEHGAIHSGAGLWQEHVVIDGNLITGQNPASARKVGEEIVQALAGL